jgi:hypothetical protein
VKTLEKVENAPGNMIDAISDAIEAYEAVRWPQGKVPGGKG